MDVNEIKNQNINHKRYFYWTVSPFYTIKLTWAEPINTSLSLLTFHVVCQSTTVAAKRVMWVCPCLHAHTQKFPPSILLLSMALYGVKYSTSQPRSAVQVVFCAIFFAHPNVLTEGNRRTREIKPRCSAIADQQQPEHWLIHKSETFSSYKSHIGLVWRERTPLLTGAFSLQQARAENHQSLS